MRGSYEAGLGDCGAVHSSGGECAGERADVSNERSSHQADVGRGHGAGLAILSTGAGADGLGWTATHRFAWSQCCDRLGAEAVRKLGHLRAEGAVRYMEIMASRQIARGPDCTTFPHARSDHARVESGNARAGRG